jgi:hypothetical protein
MEGARNWGMKGGNVREERRNKRQREKRVEMVGANDKRSRTGRETERGMRERDLNDRFPSDRGNKAVSQLIRFVWKLLQALQCSIIGRSTVRVHLF